MSHRGALAVIAAIVLGIGVLLAFVPVSVGDDVNCGSAFGTGDSGAIPDAQLADYASDIGNAYRGTSSEGETFAAQCEDRVTTQRLLAFPLAGIGALGLVFLGLTSPRARSDR